MLHELTRHSKLAHAYDELRAIYARPPDEPPRGYAVAGNHTPEFMARAKLGDSPAYAGLMRELRAPGLGGDMQLA